MGDERNLSEVIEDLCNGNYTNVNQEDISRATSYVSARRDPALLSRFCDGVGIDPFEIDPIIAEQISEINENLGGDIINNKNGELPLVGVVEKGGLDERAGEENERTRVLEEHRIYWRKPLKSPLGGLTRVGLNEFNIRNLVDMRYGRFNLFIPDDMWEALTANEWVALLMAGGRLKYSNNHLRDCSSPINFEDLLKRCNNYSYGQAGSNLKSFKSRYGENPRDQAARMRYLVSSESKKRFVEGFFKPFLSEGAYDYEEDTFFDPFFRDSRTNPKNPYITSVFDYAKLREETMNDRKRG